MATKKKLLQAAAGSAGGAGGLNVEDVFSTYLYEGTGSAQTIRNGINLGQTYGSGSVELNGVDQSLYVSHDNVFDLGTSSFTIEFFVNADTYSGDAFAVGLISGYSGYLTGIYIATSIVYGYYQWGSSNQTPLISSTVLDAKKWYHIALVRNGANFSLYVDGTSVATQTDGSAIYDSSQIFTIGEYITAAGNKLDGYISNVRFSDTARYTANFTPPTANFTSDSNTILLTCVGEDKTDLSSNALTVLERGSSIQTSIFGPHDADEDGEGGMVWIKSRTDTSYNQVQDTEIGTGKRRYPNTTDPDGSIGTAITSFNSNGFTIGTNSTINGSGKELVSWTFRKAPRFFDVVDNIQMPASGAVVVPHNLGSVPGMILLKRTDGFNNWIVWHRSVFGFGFLDTNMAWGSSPVIYANSQTFSATTNTAGTYVAYIFAHNDGDGEFGPDGDQDIIKCGSYTGTGASQEIDLGFEAQWVLIKSTTYSQSWSLIDNMRGFTVEGVADEILTPNSTTAGVTDNRVFPTASGFGVHTSDFRYNASGSNYIYIAIRRGPMAVPESATDVFTPYAPSSNSEDPYWTAGFPVVDFALGRWNTGSTGNVLTFDRLRGSRVGLETNTTDNESGVASDSNNYINYIELDHMYGFHQTAGFSSSSEDMAWMWRRAPGFFDVVAYTGDGTASHTINHNLGVVPEMIWTKNRSSATALDWSVYHSGIGRKLLILNNTDAETSYNFFPYDPTSSTWIVRNHPTTNTSGDDYIMYLFASLDGVSKVGSFSHTLGTDTNVDCGFSSGARFVLVKRTDNSGGWVLVDSSRGIVSGADPYLFLNVTDVEQSYDLIDPLSSGFTAVGNGWSTGSYIFYAIA